MKIGKTLLLFIIILLFILSLFYFGFPVNIIKPAIHNDIIERYSDKYGIDPLFVTSVIKEESNFSKKARSHSGAIGLMQVMPATALEIAPELGINNLEIKNLEDPEINIRLGTYYLGKLLKEFNGNLILTLAAYNAGINKVKNWQKENPLVEVEITDIPYEETSAYVMSVMRTYKWLKWARELKNLIRNKKTT